MSIVNPDINTAPQSPGENNIIQQYNNDNDNDNDSPGEDEDSRSEQKEKNKEPKESLF